MAAMADTTEAAPSADVRVDARGSSHHIGRREHCLYVPPREPLPIARWDYREDARIDATIDAGRRDAERYDRALDELLAECSA